MPLFEQTQINRFEESLHEYTALLEKLHQGDTALVPLEDGETPRRVMRYFNRAAALAGVRLLTLHSEQKQGSHKQRTAEGKMYVEFKVMPLEKRPVNMSPEARRARTLRARNTMLAKRAGIAKLARKPRSVA